MARNIESQPSEDQPEDSPENWSRKISQKVLSFLKGIDKDLEFSLETRTVQTSQWEYKEFYQVNILHFSHKDKPFLRWSMTLTMGWNDDNIDELEEVVRKMYYEKRENLL